MKRYIIIAFLLLSFLPLSALAGPSCDFPYGLDSDFKFFSKIEREYFKYHGYLVFIYYYKAKNPKHRDDYANFHFKNIVRLAKKDLISKNNMDINDYWDKNGRAIPYVLIEIGGTIIDDYPASIVGYTRIGTCFDRKNHTKKNIRYYESEDYEKIIKVTKELFIPVLAIEDRLEKKQ